MPLAGVALGLGLALLRNACEMLLLVDAALGSHVAEIELPRNKAGHCEQAFELSWSTALTGGGAFSSSDGQHIVARGHAAPLTDSIHRPREKVLERDGKDGSS